MKNKKKILLSIISFIFIILLTIIIINNKKEKVSSIKSPYVGQEKRGIKAISQEDIKGLLAGTGTPFGGMAKPAELNGYPGPRHVLDAFDTGEFDLSNEQYGKISDLYEEMKIQAIELGKKIIDIEKEIDDAFSGKKITDSFLEKKVSESVILYGELRVVHLKYHLLMVKILTQEQIENYNNLRGYTKDGGPCENIPKGHDSELWKKHNNC